MQEVVIPVHGTQSSYAYLAAPSTTVASLATNTPQTTFVFFFFFSSVLYIYIFFFLLRFETHHSYTEILVSTNRTEWWTIPACKHVRRRRTKIQGLI